MACFESLIWRRADRRRRWPASYSGAHWAGLSISLRPARLTLGERVRAPWRLSPMLALELSRRRRELAASGRQMAPRAPHSSSALRSGGGGGGGGVRNFASVALLIVLQLARKVSATCEPQINRPAGGHLLAGLPFRARSPSKCRSSGPEANCSLHSAGLIVRQNDRLNRLTGRVTWAIN